MSASRPDRLRNLGFAVSLLLLVTCPALAVDGVVEINAAVVEASGGFPYVIASPGSYRLTGDLAVDDPLVPVVSIRASHVSLDLNGFVVSGCSGLSCVPASGPGTGPGIAVDDADLRTGVEVSNGTVTGVAYHGILVGDHSVVRNVRVFATGGSGIRAGRGSMVSESVSQGNTENGVIVLEGSATVRDVIAADNGSSGILVGSASRVSRSAASANDITGIRAGAGSVVEGSSATGNAAYGIQCLHACSIDGNTASANGFDGISGQEGSVVRSNASFGNSTHGIRISQGGLVQGNTAYENQENGIFVTFGVAGFRENVLRANTDGQIGTGINSTALDLGDNQCGGNGSCTGATQP